MSNNTALVKSISKPMAGQKPEPIDLTGKYREQYEQWSNIVRGKDITYKQTQDSPEDFLDKFELDEIERENLTKVFFYLSNCAPNKPDEDKDYITDEDIKHCMIYFQDLDRVDKMKTADKGSDAGIKEIDKEEISLMIWEIDDDLDGRISIDEFFNSYKRILLDQELLEPRKFQHLIEYLMYNLFEVEFKDENKDEFGKTIPRTLLKPKKRFITKEDCQKLMFIKQNTQVDRWPKEFGKNNKMDSEMSWLFDIKSREVWGENGRNLNPDDGFCVVTDLKLDDFIRRKYEDLLRQREFQVQTINKKYKDNYKEINKKKN